MTEVEQKSSVEWIVQVEGMKWTERPNKKGLCKDIAENVSILSLE